MTFRTLLAFTITIALIITSATSRRGVGSGGSNTVPDGSVSGGGGGSNPVVGSEGGDRGSGPTRVVPIAGENRARENSTSTSRSMCQFVEKAKTFRFVADLESRCSCPSPRSVRCVLCPERFSCNTPTCWSSKHASRFALLHSMILYEENEESNGEEDVESLRDQPIRDNSQGEGSSKKILRKRKRSSDSLISWLERITEKLIESFEKSNEQMAKVAESITGPNQKESENRRKLDEELSKLKFLTQAERIRAGKKLVNNPNHMDYFFILQDADKEEFLKQIMCSLHSSVLSHI